MQLQTDFKLAGPLAGLFGGIEQAQGEERQGLANAYQMLKNQEQEYTSAEAQTKMKDPRYIQMKLENDISKFGKDMEMNKLEQGYNATTRALTDLKVAAAQGPQVLQQKALGYMKELGIDPNSQQGQMMLQDPIGFAEKTQQFYAAAATQNADYQSKYKLKEAEAGWGMEKQTAADAAAMQRAQLQANTSLAGQKYAADKGLTGSMLGYAKDLRGELDNINTNITKLESKEMDTAIFDAFRQSGKTDVTQADVDKYKSEQLTALRQRKQSVESDLTEARGAVRGRIGLGKGSNAPELPPGVTRK